MLFGNGSGSEVLLLGGAHARVERVKRRHSFAGLAAFS